MYNYADRVSEVLQSLSTGFHCNSTGIMYTVYIQVITTSMDIDEETAEEYRTPHVRHEVQEPTTYELAEENYKEEQKIEYEKR